MYFGQYSKGVMQKLNLHSLFPEFTIFAPLNYGEMSEWLKELAWKACVPHKGTVGSNPTLSAN